MKETLLQLGEWILKPEQLPWIPRLARHLLLRQLKNLEFGTLILREGDQEFRFVGGKQPNPQVILTVHDPRSYAQMVLGGSVGGANAYREGRWDCDSLVNLVRIFALNEDFMNRFEQGLARFQEPLRKLYHRWRRNSVTGSRRNIAEHYDLGNEFFALFLDETMTYSCGIFRDDAADLKSASLEKLDLVCRKLALRPGDSLLEIGSGWGSFALHAAKNYGARVTTTTVSAKQYAYLCETVQREGLGDRIQVLRQDYRELQGRYDKIASIEMIEAVGYPYYPTFFETCSRLLRAEGRMLLQAITIVDHAYERAKDEVDFIKRYIFPGGCLPSVGALMQANVLAGDLSLVQLEDFTPHYVSTLKAWRENFRNNLPAIRALAYSEAFIRTWEFYFAYCQGAFQERYIGLKHLLFQKPGGRPRPR